MCWPHIYGKMQVLLTSQLVRHFYWSRTHLDKGGISYMLGCQATSSRRRVNQIIYCSCFALFREWSMFSTFFLGFSNSNQTKTRPCKNQSLETSSPGFRSWLSCFFLPWFWISEMPGVSMSSFIWNRQTQEWNFPIFIQGDALGAPHCTVDGTN